MQNANGHKDYPMPSSDFGYRELTYDLSRYDSKSGLGKVQNAPFRMKKEPVWGKKHLMQLFWVYDVFFVLPEVWKSVFKPLGIECMPVLKYGSDKELKTVVQLKSQGELASSLDLEGYPKNKAGNKYLPITRGFFPKMLCPEKVSGHYFTSQEYFGSGRANKEVIVSKNFFSAVKDNKLKGVNFSPMAK